MSLVIVAARKQQAFVVSDGSVIEFLPDGSDFRRCSSHTPKFRDVGNGMILAASGMNWLLERVYANVSTFIQGDRAAAIDDVARFLAANLPAWDRDCEAQFAQHHRVGRDRGYNATVVILGYDASQSRARCVGFQHADDFKPNELDAIAFGVQTGLDTRPIGLALGSGAPSKTILRLMRKAVSHVARQDNRVGGEIFSAVVDSAYVSPPVVRPNTDTAAAGDCRRAINGGAWTPIAIGSDLTASFNVTRIPTKQTVVVQGQNALDGNWGNSATVEVDAYIADGPSLDIRVVLTDVSAQIFYTAIGTVTVSINGGSFGTPAASPITVNRSLSTDQTYEFKAVQASQTISRLVQIPRNADIGQGIISVEPIAGNTSAQANATVLIDGSGAVGSWRYSFSTSSQPIDATVALSGTLVNGRVLSLINLTTLNLGNILYVTAVPFTGISGSGAQLSPIHLRHAYTDYGFQKTVSFAAAAWDEISSAAGSPFGNVWDGSFQPTNPALPSVAVMVNAITPAVPVGVKLNQCAFDVEWNAAGTQLGAFSVAVYKANTLLNFGSPTYSAGAQTVTVGLSNVVVGSNEQVMFWGQWTGPAVGTATVSQAKLKRVHLTYIMNSTKETL